MAYRAALLDFKQSGKFVVAYNEGYSQGSYYLASVADKIYLHPEGAFSWVGMAQTSLFFKGALDKLGLNAEAIRPTVCKYKSAVEPYIRKDMSKENRLQMETIVNSMWDDVVADVANSRGLSVEELKGYASKLEINSAKDALTRGMVDKLAYEDELYDLYDNYGVKRNEHGTHNHISLSEYIAYTNIAPLYASVGDDSSIDNEKKPKVNIEYIK